MSKQNKQKGIKAFGYKRLGTEQWILSENGVIALYPYPKKVYSTELVKLNYKIGKRFKEQKYSDLIAYTLTPITPLPTITKKKK